MALGHSDTHTSTAALVTAADKPLAMRIVCANGGKALPPTARLHGRELDGTCIIPMHEADQTRLM